MSILDRADLSLDLGRREYRRRLAAEQVRLRKLEFRAFRLRMPVMVVFEGWDASGKGGTIRRLTQSLDPRGFTVISYGVPTPEEKAHHYLWRFWQEIPKHGHLAIFDRSWYGRVLVERIEGLASEEEWRRAYREINEFENQLADAGTIITKFWMHISQDEQLRRFEERKQNPYKRYKITDDDWRNRERWALYRDAVDEMLLRTSTTYAPWTVVPANSKRYARVMAIDTLADAMIQGFKYRKRADSTAA